MLLLNDVLDIRAVRFQPQRTEEVEGIGTGQILRSELADPLWRVEIETPINEFNTGRQIRAILNDLDRPQSYFRVIDPISRYAGNDPTGSLLTSVTLASRSGNQVSFAGQPSGYQFLPGDAFHCIFSGRHYYFEISQAGTGLVRTTPTVPASITVGTALVFVNPQVRLQFVPGELRLPAADSDTWKMGSFQFGAIEKR